MPLIDVDPQSGRNRDMMRESLEIMVKLWTEHVGPEFRYEGEFWTINNPSPIWPVGPHIEPWHDPHPPLAMAGLSPNSDTIRYAGEHGYIPLSLTFNAMYLKSHWQSMEEGAASAGRTADRKDWRVVTVTRRLIECYEELGGFGTLVVNKYDHGDTPDFYRRSLELLVTEVGPAFEKAIAAG